MAEEEGDDVCVEQKHAESLAVFQGVDLLPILPDSLFKLIPSWIIVVLASKWGQWMVWNRREIGRKNGLRSARIWRKVRRRLAAWLGDC